MKIVDVNILVSIASRQSTLHKQSLDWWTSAINGKEPIGLCWHVLIGFIRIMTSARILPDPLSLDQCIERVDTWLDHPNTILLQESKNHWQIYRDLLQASEVEGNVTTDAYLAALAISRGATMVSFDKDFNRFEQLRWENPLD